MLKSDFSGLAPTCQGLSQGYNDVWVPGVPGISCPKTLSLGCLSVLIFWLANPFPPYSLQKRPKPQICAKFVPAIFLGGPSGTEIWKKLSKFENGNFRTNFDNFFQISVPLTGTPQNYRWDKFWTGGRGEKGSQILAVN